MHKEKQITLGHYTEAKLREITKGEKIQLDYFHITTTTGMPKIPVFGLASEHTPEELRADGYIPTQEVIDYWEGKQ